MRVFCGVASAALGLTGLKSLGEATFSLLAGPVFRMWIPENELEASRKAGMDVCCACAGAGAVYLCYVDNHKCVDTCVIVHVCAVACHTVCTCMVLSAVNEVKKDQFVRRGEHMYACIVAEVQMQVPNGQTGQSAHTKAVFVSPEMYVCSERNLRKQCSSLGDNQGL